MQVTIWGQILFKRRGMIKLRKKLSHAHMMRLIQVPVGPITRDRAKKFNEIREGLLKEPHMIFKPLSAWFRLLKFPNNHFHEIENLACTLWRENILLSFSDTFLFLEEASGKTNQLFSFNWIAFILIDVRHLSRLWFLFD